MTDDTPRCVKCGVGFNPKRAEIGYVTCLSCGGSVADVESQRKAKCTAPAYNKGPYMYMSDKANVAGIYQQKH